MRRTINLKSSKATEEWNHVKLQNHHWEMQRGRQNSGGEEISSFLTGAQKEKQTPLPNPQEAC